MSDLIPRLAIMPDHNPMPVNRNIYLLRGYVRAWKDAEGKHWDKPLDFQVIMDVGIPYQAIGVTKTDYKVSDGILTKIRDNAAKALVDIGCTSVRLKWFCWQKQKANMGFMKLLPDSHYSGQYINNEITSAMLDELPQALVKKAKLEIEKI